MFAYQRGNTFGLTYFTSTLHEKLRQKYDNSYLANVKMATNFLPKFFPSLNPSEKSNTSAMSSLLGLDMTTGRKSCFRLSGSFCLPPYPLPAGFSVMKMPEFRSNSI